MFWFRAFLCAFLFSFSVPRAIAQAPLFGEDERLPLLDRLREAGFECDPGGVDSDPVLQCLGRIKGYPRKVALYFPSQGVRSPELLTGVVVHFHGHVIGGDDFQGTLARYRLREELARSRAFKILVIPESIGKCETYRQRISSEKDFREFQHQVVDLLGLSGLPFEITGHSGAYRPIGMIVKDLARSGWKIRVGLFDATYCRKPLSVACLGIGEYSRTFPGLLKSYFIKGSSTAIGSELLLSPEERVPLSRTDFTHFTVMNRNYSEWLVGAVTVQAN